MNVRGSPLLSVKLDGPESGQRCNFPVKACVQALLVLGMLGTLLYLCIFRQSTRTTLRVHSHAEFKEFLNYISTPPISSQSLNSQPKSGWLACLVDTPRIPDDEHERTKVETDLHSLARTWMTDCDRHELLTSRPLLSRAPHSSLYNAFDRVRNPDFWRLMAALLHAKDLDFDWTLLTTSDVYLFSHTLKSMLNSLGPDVQPTTIRMDLDGRNQSVVWILSKNAIRKFAQPHFINDEVCGYEAKRPANELVSRCLSRLGIRILTLSDLNRTMISASQIPLTRPPTNLIGIAHLNGKEMVLVHYLANRPRRLRL